MPKRREPEAASLRRHARGLPEAEEAGLGALDYGAVLARLLGEKPS